MTEVSGILTDAENQLEHICRLDFNAPAKRRRLTSIVCTIGHSSRKLEIIKEMIKLGMNMARLNFSHDSHEMHAESFRLIREAALQVSQELGYVQHVAIAVDMKGPEIRTGIIEGNNPEVELKKNDNIRLSINKDLMDKGNKECIYVDYPNIIYVVQPGTTIFLNDGAVTLVVKEVAVDCLICEITVGGPLGSRKNLQIPGVSLDLPAVSEKDRYDIKFGITNNADFVFATVRGASAIKEIRGILGAKGRGIQIIAKIDNLQALQDLEDIIQVADGIIFERSDLSVEVSVQKMFLVQKALIARCNKAGKPLICSAQFLDSMRYRPRPKRAEVADLGNAVLDGADCVMLASQSAIGNYTLECITYMASVCHEAESALYYRHLFEDLVARNPSAIDATHAIAIAAVDAAKKSMATAIVVLTTSGKAAYLIARYRPRCPIIAVTRCARTARQTYIYRGVFPLLYTEPQNDDWIADVDGRVQQGLLLGKKMKIIGVGDSVVIVSPWKDGVGFTNNLRIIYAFYETESVDCILQRTTK